MGPLPIGDGKGLIGMNDEGNGALAMWTKIREGNCLRISRKILSLYADNGMSFNPMKTPSSTQIVHSCGC